MTAVSIKPSTQEHVLLIEDKLRDEAIKEIQFVGPNTRDAIKYALVLSRYAWTGFANDEVVCMWGLQPSSFISKVSTLWLLTTPLVEKHSFLFLRWSQRFMEELRMGSEFDLIHGQVRSDFGRSLWWIKWLGFKLNAPDDGLRYFYWERT